MYTKINSKGGTKLVFYSERKHNVNGDGIVFTKVVWKDCKEQNKGIVIIPLEEDGLPVIGIEPNAFYAIKSDIKQVYINAKIEKLEPDLFIDASMLTNIILPETIKYIGSNCFRRCFSLSSINLPNGLKYIGEAAFMESGLKQIDIPEQATLKPRVFERCELLKNVSWPKSAAIIPERTFLGCIRLQSFDFSEDIFEIGERAFMSTYMRKADLSRTALQPNMVANVFDKQTKIIFPYFCNSD